MDNLYIFASQNMSKHLTILVVEDEEIMLTALEFRMRKHGFNVVLARDGQQAINYLASNTPDAIVTDMMMPNVDGVTLIAALRAIDPDVRIAVASGVNTPNLVSDARRLGAEHWLAKPYTAETLLVTLRELLAD